MQTRNSKNQRVASLILLLIIAAYFPSTPVALSYPSTPSETGTWHYVGGTGVGNYTHIQDAIDAASDGDTVFVYAVSSPYYEHLVMTKSITLLGQNQTTTILDGQNTSTIVRINSDYVTIGQFTFRNSGGEPTDAALLIQANLTTLSNCTLYRARTGINISQGTHHTIVHCNVHTTAEGIYAMNTTSLSISDCQFCHNAIGLRLTVSTNCTLENSFFHTNGYGCYFDRSSMIRVEHCALDDNNDNQGGAYLVGCSTIVVNNSNINHNGVGVNIASSQDISIAHCDLNRNTKLAVFVEGTTHNLSLLSDEISNNYHYGIRTLAPLLAHANNFYQNELHALSATIVCDATQNWWNSIRGPSLTEFGRGERISKTKVHCIPWLLQPSLDAGSTWETEDCFTPLSIPINAPPLTIEGTDTDQDGVPDWWELKYNYDPFIKENHTILDPDQDGLTNMEECYTDHWGSDPFKQDIFLEIDWMESNSTTTNKPDQHELNQAIALFTAHNITLHIDTGALGGGEMIPYHASPTYLYFRDLYWTYFLHLDLNSPRKGIFRYAIITDDGEAGYTLFGWDQLDFFNAAAQKTQENHPFYTKQHIIIRIVLHELGHDLGLFGDTFGAIDNRESIKFTSWQTWRYLPYKSCMNYHYTYQLLGYSDGTRGKGDFNDWAYLNLPLFSNTSFPTPPHHP